MNPEVNSHPLCVTRNQVILNRATDTRVLSIREGSHAPIVRKLRKKQPTGPEETMTGRPILPTELGVRLLKALPGLYAYTYMQRVTRRYAN